jgi:hypothetical protein
MHSPLRVQRRAKARRAPGSGSVARCFRSANQEAYRSLQRTPSSYCSSDCSIAGPVSGQREVGAQHDNCLRSG